MRPRGLTIVEMIVSLACVIILMLAYTQLFSDVGGRISDARSMIELETRMRSASNRLHTDLAAVTCDMMPWQKPEAGCGYFEIIEGKYRDINNLNTVFPTAKSATVLPFDPYFLGDIDDILMFTVRSKEGPFTGRYVDPSGTQVTVQSEVAEVVWFLRPTMSDPSNSGTAKVFTNPPTYTLYRRVFLVMPTYQGSPTKLDASATKNLTASSVLLPQVDPNGTGTSYFYDRNDVSVHIELQNNTPVAVANTLGDLTKRECRYGHGLVNSSTPHQYGYPYCIDAGYYVPFGGVYNPSPNVQPPNDYTTNPSHPHYGEDAVLTNVVAFDVKVWDPTAPLYLNGSTTVGPGDPGYTSAVVGNNPFPSANAPVSQGAFVDLNWSGHLWDPTNPNSLKWAPNVVLSPFCSTGHPASKLNTNGAVNPVGSATYDTWSYHYEHDGVNEANPASPSTNPDPATDGFQDDVGKYETSPPYPVPLRGIKVIIRCYEPDSRQFHEVSVVESFVPE
jgi:hypothetical protein